MRCVNLQGTPNAYETEKYNTNLLYNHITEIIENPF